MNFSQRASAKARRASPFAWLVLASFCAAPACSVISLDYLQAENGTPAGGTSGSGGSGASGGTGGAGGSSGASGTQATGGTATGGTATGGASQGGSPGGGEAGESGGEGGSGATTGGSSGAGQSGGSSGAGGKAGGGGSGAAGSGGGTAGSGPAFVYGVRDQSCSGNLTCPGGKSCCSDLEVPQGSFSMGTNTDPSRSSDEEPPHTANLAAYYLDEFEVTVGRFRRFVDVYDGTPPAVGSGAHGGVPARGWQTGYSAELPVSRAELLDAINCDAANGYQAWTEFAGVRDSMPMNCVSWYVAFAFCIWDGRRLPSEAEWEKAATGGSEDRRYPWGATAPDAAMHALFNCLGDGTSGCNPADLLAVGSRTAGAGRYGHLDLAGSLWEWTLDYYSATYYQSIGTCDDCVDIGGTTPRVTRGGNFTALPATLRATERASKAPNAIDAYAGFRCARST